MRTMYDSVTTSDIPKHARMVAAYTDGYYGNVEAVRQRCKKATVVTITVNGSTDANVIDCETGDATPSGAAAWAKRQVQAGRHPTIYMNASTWPAVKAAVTRAGIKGKVSYWVAHYDGIPEIPAGAVAKQYLGSPGNSPGHYDVSVVADFWPGVDSRPHRPKRLRYGPIRSRVVPRITHALNSGRVPSADAKADLLDLCKAVGRVKP